jgi:hypothetical protein
MVLVKVGEERFNIDVDKVNAYPDTTIAAALRFNKNKAKRELDFSYRSVRLFHAIMDLYNTGKLTVPKDVTYASLKDELSFWGFDLAVPVVRTNQQFTLFDTQPSTSLSCPWGTYSRELGSACWMPLACFIWSAILASPTLIETAALGYNDITIYIKHTSDSDTLGISLLVLHKQFLQRLGELSACTVRFIDGVYGQDVHREARTQDLYSAHNAAVQDWKLVHDQEITATSSMKMGSVSISTVAPVNIAFEWKGYSVRIDIDGTTLFWDCTCPDADKEDPLYLQDVCGFLLRISFVIDGHVLEGFIIPSTKKRYLQIKLLYGTCKAFVVPPDQPRWYMDMDKVGSKTPCLSDRRLQGVSSVVVLIEEATRGALNLEHIVPVLDVPFGVFFERLNICF